MQDAFYVSALGMFAQQSQLNIIAGNLANANTPAYKSERLNFANLLDRTAPAAAVQSDASAPSADQSNVLHVTRDMSQGQLQASSSSLDVAINGPGFLEVELGDGRLGYVRAGSLKITNDGFLSTASGQLLHTDVRIPTGATSLQIDSQGVVSARLGSDSNLTDLGQLKLALFTNPDGLTYTGDGIYTKPQEMSEPILAAPGQQGLGTLSPNQIEMSNVNLVDQMVALMLAQRVYELNSKVAQAADDMTSMANNLRHN